MMQLTPIEMRVFSDCRDRTDAVRRRFTRHEYWLLWPFHGQLVELSVLIWAIDKITGHETDPKSFWAWVSNPDQWARSSDF